MNETAAGLASRRYRWELTKVAVEFAVVITPVSKEKLNFKRRIYKWKSML
jgi:hypothetical protein